MNFVRPDRLRIDLAILSACLFGIPTHAIVDDADQEPKCLDLPIGSEPSGPPCAKCTSDQQLAPDRRPPQVFTICVHQSVPVAQRITPPIQL
jgi:hypothetical protein